MRIHSTAALCAFCLSACIPIPHWTTVTPELRGLLLERGLPVAGAQLYITQHAECREPQEETTTNIEGWFRFKETTDFHLYGVVLGHYQSQWRLCLRRTDNVVSIFNDFAYSMGGAPPEQVVICDLKEPDARGRTCWERASADFPDKKI